MELIVQPEQVRSAGEELIKLANEVNALYRKASGVYGRLSRCYGQGGAAYGSMATAVSKMNADSSTILERASSGLLTAALTYETAEEEIRGRCRDTVSAIENGYRVDWSARPAIAAILASKVGTYDATATKMKEAWADLKILSEQPTYNQKVFGKTIGTALDDIKASYDNHGFFYDVAEYGKCVLRVGKAGIKLFGAGLTIASGVGVPIGIVSAISAANDLTNAINDGINVYYDQYDQVGATNALKDTLVKNGGDLGEMLGNREAGERFGELTYTGVDVITFLDGADKMLKAFGKVNTDIYGSTGYSFVWGETSWDDMFDNEIKWTDIIDDKPDFTSFSGLGRIILGVDPDSPFNFLYEAGESTYKVYKKGVKVRDDLEELLGAN